MSLIVEDGTGLSNSESYISVDDADTYIGLYKGADALWDAASVSDKEIAARKATQYIDGAYPWIGATYSSSQALEWPRSGLYDEHGSPISGIPINLEQATAEAMFLLINDTELAVDVDRSSQVKREKVDVIEVEYEPGATQQPMFTTITRLVAKYIHSSGRVIRG
jgi:hypothetical protein